jgi:hypothetical protein
MGCLLLICRYFSQVRFCVHLIPIYGCILGVGTCRYVNRFVLGALRLIGQKFRLRFTTDFSNWQDNGIHIQDMNIVIHPLDGHVQSREQHSF